MLRVHSTGLDRGVSRQWCSRSREKKVRRGLSPRNANNYEILTRTSAKMSAFLMIKQLISAPGLSGALFGGDRAGEKAFPVEGLGGFPAGRGQAGGQPSRGKMPGKHGQTWPKPARRAARPAGQGSPRPAARAAGRVARAAWQVALGAPKAKKGLFTP